MDLSQFIKGNVEWDALPSNIRDQLHGSEREYSSEILQYCLENQLVYPTNMLKQVNMPEKKYYRNLLDISLKSFRLYPYHLMEKMACGLRVTPYLYYRDMLIYAIRNEQSYDSLPNFTANDCLGLLGIGRNQFINITNTYRSFLSSTTSAEMLRILKELLPLGPLLNVRFQPWYRVRISAVFQSDIESSSSTEHMLIDRIINASNATSGELGLAVKDVDLVDLKSLYYRGLVYFEIPIYGHDRIYIPTLERFVMNRISGDSQEKLLYKMFLTVDDNTTIHELADCLRLDLDLVRQAASLICRLGFAYKRSPSGVAGAPAAALECSGTTANADASSASVDCGSTRTRKKIAFIVDSVVTACLMTNVCPGLIQHAVTIFEVGKLANKSMDTFLSELENLCEVDEPEAHVYVEHARNLGQVLHFIRAQSQSDNTDFVDLDVVRGESLFMLDSDTRVRILQKNYSLVVSNSSLTYKDRQPSCIDWPVHIGPPVPEANSAWFRLFVTFLADVSNSNRVRLTSCPQPYSALPGIILSRGSRFYRIPECFEPYSRFLVCSWGCNPTECCSSALLNVVNNALLSVPVFAQAVGFYESRRRDKMHVRYIPLPLSPAVLDPKEADSRPAFINNLMDNLDLSLLCGYITVLFPKQPSPGEPTGHEEGDDAEVSQDTGNSPDSIVIGDSELLQSVSDGLPMYFITMNLGVPIFNGTLAKAVCARMIGQGGGVNLFSRVCRDRLKSANMSLVNKLRQFIHVRCGGEYPIADDTDLQPATAYLTDDGSNGDVIPDNLPIPSQSVLCADGQLIDLL